MGITELRKARIAAGLCRDCGKVPPVIGNICGPCSWQRKARQVNRAQLLKAKGVCLQCKAPAMPDKTLCKQCMDIAADNARERRKKNKIAVVELYGDKCQECGESDIRCLTVDHINNDGNIDCAGKSKRITSNDFYAKLVKCPKRDDLKLLCANCHYKKDLSPWWYEED